MKKLIEYLKFLIKEPINTIAEANTRKKAIMPFFYGSVGAMVLGVTLQTITEIESIWYFSFIALVVAVVIYFWIKPFWGVETVSWMCVLGAAPFAALGFINYHGLNAEQLLWAWLKSEIIEPKKLIFESSTLYYDVLKENITKREKEAMKSNDKNSPDND